MQDNQVLINDWGIIEIHVVGDQTAASVQVMGDEALRLAESLRRAGKRSLILDNLLQMGAVPIEARKLVVDLVKSGEYDRLAMLGTDTLLRFGANLMLQATGKGSRVRYFEDREKCIEWLLKP